MTSTTNTTNVFKSRKRKQPCGVGVKEVSKSVSKARASQRSREQRFHKRMKTLEDRMKTTSNATAQQHTSLEHEAQHIIDHVQSAENASQRKKLLKEQKKRLDTIADLKARLQEAEDTEQQYQQSCLEVMKIRSNLARSTLTNMREIQKIAKQMPFGFIKNLLLRDRNFVLSSLLSFNNASTSSTTSVFLIDAFFNDTISGDKRRVQRFTATLVPEQSTSYEAMYKAQKDYETLLKKRMQDFYDYYGWSTKHRSINGTCSCGKNDAPGACLLPDALHNQIYSALPIRPEPKLVFRTLPTVVKNPEEYEPQIKNVVEQGFKMTFKCSNPCIETLRAVRHRHILSRERGSVAQMVSKSYKEQWIKRPWREWTFMSGPWTYRLNIDVFLCSTPLRTEAKTLHDDLFTLVYEYL